MSIKAVIGIDIGGTFTKYGGVDRGGRTYFENSISTDRHPDVESYLKALHKAVTVSIEESGESFDIQGIGIGAPNGNYYNGTIEYAPNLNWKGIINLTEMLGKYFKQMPIVLTNDANAAALGEMVYGGAKNMKNFIVVTLGTGLGSGIVADGKVVYGHDGFAGELGHVIVIENGRQCGCGNRGCLETYASATGIKRTVFELLAKRTDKSRLRSICFQDMTAKLIYEAALEKDPIALEAFEYTGEILGKKLAEAVAITSPEAIFLFGGLAKSGDFIFMPTKASMEKHLLNIYKNKVKLLPSGIEDKNTAVLGAAGLIWNELID